MEELILKALQGVDLHDLQGAGNHLVMHGLSENTVKNLTVKQKTALFEMIDSVSAPLVKEVLRLKRANAALLKEIKELKEKEAPPAG